MAFSMSPTSSTVAITGSVTATLPSPPAGSTIVHVSGTTGTSGSTTIYTVTAGKTLYITSASMAIFGNGGGATTSQLDADTAGTGTYKNILCTAQVTAGVSNAQLGYPIAIQVPATKTVRVTHSAAVTAAYMIYGYEA